MESDESSIQNWVAQAREGDEDAFRRLVEHFSSPLQVLLYRILLDWNDALDATQEAFIQAWKNLGRYEESGKFQSWLYQIGVNRARDILRKRVLTQEFTEDERTGSAGNDRAETSELGRAIEQAVGELNEEQRTAFVLAEYEGMSHQEIGEIMKNSPKSVEMLIYRARQALKEKLQAHWDENQK